MAHDDKSGSHASKHLAAREGAGEAPDAYLEMSQRFLRKHPDITVEGMMRLILDLEDAAQDVRHCLSNMVRTIEGGMNMERWQRPDPVLHLMDVYAQLATPCSILDKVIVPERDAETE